MSEKQTSWILERLANERFPYRLRVVRGEETLLALRAQDKWPAAGKNYFCLRDEGPRDDWIRIARKANQKTDLPTPRLGPADNLFERASPHATIWACRKPGSRPYFVSS